MGAIFLSYAREDRGCAARLADVLETAGHDVWWDRRLDGGEEFSDEIEAALDKSEVVVVAWSQESIRSRWVRDEAGVGCDKGSLVPVSIDGSVPPMGFRQFHTLDLTGWKAARNDERTNELLRSVERRLKGKEEPSPGQRPAKPPRRFSLPQGKPFWFAVAALAFIAAVAAFLAFQKIQNAASQPLKPTIALLPFNAGNEDASLREIATQTRDSIAHTFSQSGVPLRLMNAAPQPGQPSVDFLMSGDVSRSGDKIVATVRLAEAAHGSTVYSQQFEASRDEVRDLPERIGAQMAGNLTTSAKLPLLDPRLSLDPAILTDLLQDNFTGDMLRAYQIAKRSAAKAPDVPLAQLGVAYSTAFIMADLPLEERAGAVAEARQAADRAVELAPKFGEAYSPWCLLRSETLFAACEDRLRLAKRVDPDAPYVNTFLSHLLRSVGRFDESADLAKLAHTHDIYVPTKIGWMLKAMEFEGDSAGVQDLYQQAVRWWPEYQWMFIRNRLFSLIDRGDFQAMQQLEREVKIKNLDPDYVTSDELVAALKSRSIAAARKTCPDGDDMLLNLRCMIALAQLGDQDGAYAIAAKLYPQRVGRTPAETERIWMEEPDTVQTDFIASPGSAPMRRDPRYIQLAERSGLLAYWRSGRPPDFCRRHPEPICKQLFKRK
ncbi:TIR domain-containing protein [Sphingomonas sp. NSE70-1]|uniref:TIR domain-containing protein n=1 Tax=Sphingomonas caseinilyticus TaxID=2908205 RepID=A0ABT0RXM1_9SPHN|nr:TIR domain-containing protein [Sphingomonas caseinilyticus]MCL6699716.1 TIR domain-containing protein [Sphingomonas caseinilyticus]